MKKLLCTPIMLFIVLAATQVYAQDSVKKTPVIKAQPTGAVKIQPKTAFPIKPTTTPVNALTTRQIPAAAAPVNNDHSLNGQYRYLLTKVYNYQQPLVGAFYKNLMDTLRTERIELKKAKATVATQEATIKGLSTDVSTKDETISQSNAKVDEIKLLGIPFTKATYNLVMWGLVIGFGAALAIVIVTTARFKHEAKYRIKLYEELSEEFQTYKAKANEKEKKLARELQTERNKLDELLGR